VLKANIEIDVVAVCVCDYYDASEEAVVLSRITGVVMVNHASL
jgi:hypothetical protein